VGGDVVVVVVVYVLGSFWARGSSFVGFRFVSSARVGAEGRGEERDGR